MFQFIQLDKNMNSSMSIVTPHNLHITITIPVLHISIQAYSFSKNS